MQFKNYLLFICLFLVLLNSYFLAIIISYINLTDRVIFLDVGQGDAEFIQTKTGNILIDAGSFKVVEELGKVMPWYDKIIDVAILSHPHKDHFLGFFDLLERYKVRTVIINNVDCANSLYQQFLDTLKEKNILVLDGRRQVKVSLAQKDYLLIFPDPKTSPKADLNEVSLITLADLQQLKFLFTGDIESRQEKNLINLLPNLLSNIFALKVPHHGSNFSNSNDFLSHLTPKIAVIEVGENSFGHPAVEIIERYKFLSTKLLRTDLDGTVILELTPQGVKLIKN